MDKNRLKIDRHLFDETSHSPSLVDIVGEDRLDRVVDFCFIENPYFPGKALLQKIQQKLPVLIKFYPSSNPVLAQKELASVVHAQPEHLVIGNGATELITIIQNQLVSEMGIPVPTFSEYIEKLEHSGKVKLFELPHEKGYQLDLDAYAEWLEQEKPDTALIINPGNPTGQLIGLDEMLAFLRRMKHLKLILVDESFIDFAGDEIPSLIPRVAEFPNLIIVRSMSKHCGVPGLRLGYCCTANEVFLRKIRNVLPVWNINTLAEYFLTQLRETDREYHVARKKVIADVELLFNQLKEIDGFEVYPTGSNFILLKIKGGSTAYDVQMRLLEEFGVYVRDCSNKTGMDKFHIRVSSKGRKKDKVLVEALRQISKDQGSKSQSISEY